MNNMIIHGIIKKNLSQNIICQTLIKSEEMNSIFNSKKVAVITIFGTLAFV